MASWTLVPCLTSLRHEFNQLAPVRDLASDGSIGDLAHSKTKSDHNPDSRGLVHAIDVDKDLRAPGWTMQKAVDLIVDRHRRGVDERLTYVIYNRAIWSATHGWRRRVYTGSNPHDKHAHFSAAHTPRLERDTSRWGLLAESARLEEDVDDATVKKIAEATRDAVLVADLGKKGGGDTVGVALQTGALQNTTRILAGLGALAQVVAGLPQAVLEELGDNTDQTALQQATILRSVLGHDRAAEVGRLLTGPQ